MQLYMQLNERYEFEIPWKTKNSFDIQRESLLTGGQSSTSLQEKMAPAWAIVVLDEKPASNFFCVAKSKILHEGIWLKLVKPPAIPINFAAVDAPTIIDKFGAIKLIRDSTYDKINCLSSLNFFA